MTSTTAPRALDAPYHGASRASAPILVATAGTDGRAAIETARALAARDGCGVAVVSAVEPAQLALSPAGVPYVASPREYIDAQRTHVMAQLRAVGGVAEMWPLTVVVDEPAHAIADAARAMGASLIVVGAGRHDPVARVLGETAVRVARRAPCPVLAVGPRPLRVPPQVAVVAVDFSPASAIAAHAALDLLAAGGTLHLVHVWARHVLDVPALHAVDDAYEHALPTRFAHLERELLDRACDVTILPTSLLGDPVERLLGFARTHGADVIAAGRQGHGILELVFAGRVTTALLHAADRAVLVTPAPTLAERDALQRRLSDTSESRAHTDWSALLDAFSRRNAGRRTRLEIDDPALGAQTYEVGRTLTGVTYDRHDHRTTLMFGDRSREPTNVTRSIERVTSIAVQTDERGEDIALRLAHGTGQTLLTFLPGPAA